MNTEVQTVDIPEFIFYRVFFLFLVSSKNKNNETKNTQINK